MTGEGLTERRFFFAAGKRGWTESRTRLVWGWLQERRASGKSLSAVLESAESLVEAFDTLPPGSCAPPAVERDWEDNRRGPAAGAIIKEPCAPRGSR